MARYIQCVDISRQGTERRRHLLEGHQTRAERVYRRLHATSKAAGWFCTVALGGKRGRARLLVEAVNILGHSRTGKEAASRATAAKRVYLSERL